MPDVHILDEAQDVPAVAEEARHGHDARFVDPTADDHVDLDRRQADTFGGCDPLEDAIDREVDVVHPPEGRVVQRIEADGDPLQARVGQGGRLPGEQ